MFHRRLTLIAILTILLLGALSACGVVIDTPPIKVADPYYIDLNGDGIYTEDEFIDYVVVYNGDGELTFSWQPIFVEGVSSDELSYRVSLFQTDVSDDFYSDPAGVDPNGEYVYERKVAHHWASNANATTFTMGSFGFVESICFGCPTFIFVNAEKIITTYDPITGTYEYEYILIESNLDGDEEDWEIYFRISDFFFLESAR